MSMLSPPQKKKRAFLLPSLALLPNIYKTIKTYVFVFGYKIRAGRRFFQKN